MPRGPDGGVLHDAAHDGALTGRVNTRTIEARRQAATAWRLDHTDDPHRDNAWTWYTHGATWRVRDQIEVRSILHGLLQAERIIRWDATLPDTP